MAEEEAEKPRLRPVVYTTNYFQHGAQKTAQQLFLLKALSITQDPKRLKQMIGVRSVAEVYRTLDKLAMRKEYHEALARAGISFDYIVGGIKKIADKAPKASDRLNAFKALLKSVGMETYDTDAVGTTGTWEEVLLKKLEEAKKDNVLAALPGAVEGSVAVGTAMIHQYEVKVPEMPESARKMQEEEAEMTASIYDQK